MSMTTRVLAAALADSPAMTDHRVDVDGPRCLHAVEHHGDRIADQDEIHMSVDPGGPWAPYRRSIRRSAHHPGTKQPAWIRLCPEGRASCLTLLPAASPPRCRSTGFLQDAPQTAVLPRSPASPPRQGWTGSAQREIGRRHRRLPQGASKRSGPQRPEVLPRQGHHVSPSGYGRGPLARWRSCAPR